MIPCVRSISAKKRKEKLFLFPSKVSKLNIKAKRIVTIPYPNESLEEDDKLVEDEVSPSAANTGLGGENSEDVSEAEAEDDDPKRAPGSDNAECTCEIATKPTKKQDVQELVLSATHSDRKVTPFDVAILEKVGVHNSDRYFELLGVANALLPMFCSQDDADQRVGTRASPSPLDAAIVAKIGIHNTDFFYEVKDAINDCHHLIGSHEDEGSSSDEDDEGEGVDGEGEGAVAVASPSEDADAPVTPTGPTISVTPPRSLPCSELKSHVDKIMDASSMFGSKLSDEDPLSYGNFLSVSQSIPKIIISDGDGVEGSAYNGNQQAMDGEENGFNSIDCAITQPQMFEACGALDNGNILDPRVNNAPNNLMDHVNPLSHAHGSINAVGKHCDSGPSRVGPPLEANDNLSFQPHENATSSLVSPYRALSPVHVQDKAVGPCRVALAAFNARAAEPACQRHMASLVPSIDVLPFVGPHHNVAAAGVSSHHMSAPTLHDCTAQVLDTIKVSDSIHDLVLPKAGSSSRLGPGRHMTKSHGLTSLFGDTHSTISAVQHKPHGLNACTPGQLTEEHKPRSIGAHDALVSNMDSYEVSLADIQGQISTMLTSSLRSQVVGHKDNFSNGTAQERIPSGVHPKTFLHCSGSPSSPSPKLFSQLFDEPRQSNSVFPAANEEHCHDGVSPLHESFHLDFVSHGFRSETLVLPVPKALTDEGKKDWEFTLVGYFIGKNLPYSLVTSATNRLWAEFGEFDTLATADGFYFFSFLNEMTRDAILGGGPWYIAGRPLILQPWKPNLKLDKEGVQTIPIWVNFFGIPLELWNPKGISYIASFIGKPLRVDNMTASRRRITYARVCIEVSGDQDLIEKFALETENENGSKNLIDIKVEYQWFPPRCSKCSIFGHDCSKPPKISSNRTYYQAMSNRQYAASQQWVPVKKSATEASLKATPSNESPEGGQWTEVTSRAKGKAKVVALEANHEKPRQNSPATTLASAHQVKISNSFNELIPYVYDVSETDHTPDGGVDPVDEEDMIQRDLLDAPVVTCSQSSRQKKREAKKQFSLSRPKGRHRA